MIKYILILSCLYASLMSKSYDFVEYRYIDALDKSIKLEGKITFKKDYLSVFYPKSKKFLEYQNDNLIYKENDVEISLNEMQSQKIMQYFEILILLHNDDSYASEIFEIQKKDNKIILIPQNEIKDYIQYIELNKEHKELKKIIFFLQNADKITIEIDNEIY